MRKKPIQSLRPIAGRASTRVYHSARRASVRAGATARVVGRAIPQQQVRRTGRFASTAFFAVLFFGVAHANAATVSAPINLATAPIAATARVVHAGSIELPLRGTLNDVRPTGLTVELPPMDPELRCPRGAGVEPLDLRDPAIQERLLTRFFETLQAPRSPEMDAALLTWVRAEGWDHGWLRNNNPLSLRVTGEGVCGQWNSAGVAIIASLERGAELAAMRLTGKSAKFYGYDAITDAARRGSPAAFFQAIARSAWNSPSYYGCGENRRGHNYLVDLWRDVAPELPPIRSRC